MALKKNYELIQNDLTKSVDKSYLWWFRLVVVLAFGLGYLIGKY